MCSYRGGAKEKEKQGELSLSQKNSWFSKSLPPNLEC